jgi:ABC-type phosphate transport system substrate-binding protein
MRTFAFLVVATVLTLMALCGTLIAHATPPTPIYQIVVHPSNPSVVVDRRFLEDAFLKKITIWPSGEVIRPVDLPPDSPIRKRFTEDVLKRSVEDVKSYWQQRIFSGHDVPPPELDTDEDVVTYVVEHGGAVGYVSGSADLRGTKVLAVR